MQAVQQITAPFAQAAAREAQLQRDIAHRVSSAARASNLSEDEVERAVGNALTARRNGNSSDFAVQVGIGMVDRIVAKRREAEKVTA